MSYVAELLKLVSKNRIRSGQSNINTPDTTSLNVHRFMLSQLPFFCIYRHMFMWCFLMKKCHEHG